MISVDGYKAFHGTMLISPVNDFTPFELTGDWLYKPEYDCWYGSIQYCGCRSFAARICKIIEEEKHNA